MLYIVAYFYSTVTIIVNVFPPVRECAHQGRGPLGTITVSPFLMYCLLHVKGSTSVEWISFRHSLIYYLYALDF